jgi:hypothetical protein
MSLDYRSIRSSSERLRVVPAVQVGLNDWGPGQPSARISHRARMHVLQLRQEESTALVTDYRLRLDRQSSQDRRFPTD